MVPGFARDVVTVVWPGVVVERGSRKWDYDHPERLVVVSRCVLQPQQSQEVQGDRDAVLDAWRLFAPPGTELAPECMVLLGAVPDEVAFSAFRGVRLEVVGEPQRWASPSGALNHVEAQLRRWRDGGDDPGGAES